MVVVLPFILMMHVALRSFSRALNGRTRTATLTLSAMFPLFPPPLPSPVTLFSVPPAGVDEFVEYEWKRFFKE